MKVVSEALPSEGILRKVEQTTQRIRSRLRQLNVVRVVFLYSNWSKALRLAKSSGAQLA